MKRKELKAGILLNESQRSAGEADFDGRHVKWGAGYLITYVPFEGTEVVKRIVDPNMAEAVEKTLADVRWGALISLELRGKYITNVTVEADPVGDLEKDI